MTLSVKFTLTCLRIIGVGQTKQISIEIALGLARNTQDIVVHPYGVYTAFKCNLDTFFFRVPLHTHLLLVSFSKSHLFNGLQTHQGELSASDFDYCFSQSQQNHSEFKLDAIPQILQNVDTFRSLLRENNIYLVNEEGFGSEKKYDLSQKFQTGEFAYISIALNKATNTSEFKIRSDNKQYNDAIYQSLIFILSQ